jgi:hypothetical protein
MKQTGLFLVALSLFGCDLTQDLGGSGGSGGSTATGGSGGTTATGGSTASGGAGGDTSSGGTSAGGMTMTGGSAGMTTTGGSGGNPGTGGMGGMTTTGGSAGAGGAETEWALSNPSGFVRPEAVTIDGNGYITVAGSFFGTADIGSGSVTSKGQRDVFIARYTGEGSLVWVKTYGSTGDDTALEIGSDAAGNLYVAGDFWSTMDLGSGPITSQGAWDVFLMKLDPAGNTVWAKDLGGGNQSPNMAFPFAANLSLAIGPNGDIAIADTFLDPVHFGNVVLTVTGPNIAPSPNGTASDFFVARLDTNGSHVWSHAYGDPDSDYALDDVVSDIGLDASGNVFVTGHFGGAVDFGGGPLGVAGDSRLLVLELDPAGKHVWSKAFGGHLSFTEAMAVTSDGGVLLAGEYKNALDFNGTQLPATAAKSLFTAKLTANGATVFTHGVPCPMDTSFVTGAAADAAGNAGIAGATEQHIDFGGGDIQTMWPGDYPFYGRYDANGAVLTGKLYTGSPPDKQIPQAAITDLAYDKATGEVVLVGVFSPDLDFGGAQVKASGFNNMFVARLSP